MLRRLLMVLTCLSGGLSAADSDPYKQPPGPKHPQVWPPQELPGLDQASLNDIYFRNSNDKDIVRLYFPKAGKPVQGILFWVDYSSFDPRELAEHLNYALLYVGIGALYNFGTAADRRDDWVKAGHKPVGGEAFFTWLDQAAEKYQRPELRHAPIICFAGQNGCFTFRQWYQLHPERLMGLVWAWARAEDSGWMKTIPLIHADENRSKAAPRTGPTPPPNLLTRSVQYGFGHGIMSGIFWGAFQIERYVKLRTPANADFTKGPVKLNAVDITAGWAGDWAYTGNWAPIAPFAQAKDMADPIFLPDEYSAWAWRSFHTASPEITLTAPAISYRSGSDLLVGFGRNHPGKVGAATTFTATAKQDLALMEFYSGNIKLGEVKTAPWKLDGVQLTAGIHCLHAIGTRKDGSRTDSRATFYRVEP